MKPNQCAYFVFSNILIWFLILIDDSIWLPNLINVLIWLPKLNPYLTFQTWKWSSLIYEIIYFLLSKLSQSFLWIPKLPHAIICISKLPHAFLWLPKMLDAFLSSQNWPKHMHEFPNYLIHLFAFFWFCTKLKSQRRVTSPICVRGRRTLHTLDLRCFKQDCHRAAVLYLFSLRYIFLNR